MGAKGKAGGCRRGYRAEVSGLEPRLALSGGTAGAYATWRLEPPGAGGGLGLEDSRIRLRVTGDWLGFEGGNRGVGALHRLTLRPEGEAGDGFDDGARFGMRGVGGARLATGSPGFLNSGRVSGERSGVVALGRGRHELFMIGGSTPYVVSAGLAGDVDGDGRVTRGDLELIETAIGGGAVPGGIAWEAVDVDGDGRVTRRDARLARWNLGARTTWRGMWMESEPGPGRLRTEPGMRVRVETATAAAAAGGGWTRTEGRADGSGAFGWETGAGAGAGWEGTLSRLTVEDEFGRRIGETRWSRGESPALVWNAATMDAVRRNAIRPTVASRMWAMTHLAMWDVQEFLEGNSGAYLDLRTPELSEARRAFEGLGSETRGLARDAALDAAGRTVLSGLFPEDAERLGREFPAPSFAGLANEGERRALELGRRIGEAAGRLMLEARGDDGSNAREDYAPPEGWGMWRPTPPGFASFLTPHWGFVRPFAMDRGDARRPTGPPEPDSAEFLKAMEEVWRLGGASSADRTADQWEIAKFWEYDDPGEATPPGHWNQIAGDLARREGLSTRETTRLFGLLNAALADGAIAAWDAKRAFPNWRPVTAIADHGMDDDWTPALNTPSFPDYVSGHSTFGGAAAVALGAVFGEDYGFEARSDELPGVTRRFGSFREAAEENAASRLYGGVHFRFANEDGVALGEAVGRRTLERFGGTGRSADD